MSFFLDQRVCSSNLLFSSFLIKLLFIERTQIFKNNDPSRCPAFPPSLYNYVNEHPDDKSIVLILNKVPLWFIYCYFLRPE